MTSFHFTRSTSSKINDNLPFRKRLKEKEKNEENCFSVALFHWLTLSTDSRFSQTLYNFQFENFLMKTVVCCRLEIHFLFPVEMTQLSWDFVLHVSKSIKLLHSCNCKYSPKVYAKKHAKFVQCNLSRVQCPCECIYFFLFLFMKNWFDFRIDFDKFCKIACENVQMCVDWIAISLARALWYTK